MPGKRGQAEVYSTGAPCRHGHISPRYVADRKCVECVRIKRTSPRQQARDAASREARREEIRAYHKAWRAKNPDRVRAYEATYLDRHGEKREQYFRKYSAKNRTRIAAVQRAYRATDPERWREYGAQWKRQNTYLVAHYTAKRRAILRRAMPVWAEVDAIEHLYAEARRLTLATGIEHHVDHIIPVINEWVCGLHVPGNLRVVTAQVNWEKNNRFDPALAMARQENALNV